PDCGVYQMPPRFDDCLPRDSHDVSLTSRTVTTSSCSARPRIASVTSSVKGRYPPVWPPTSTPLTLTRHDWSTAPKCSSTRPSPGSNSSVRRYQSVSSAPRCRPTPDSGVSGENGTTISPSHSPGTDVGSATSSGSDASKGVIA